MHGAHQGTYDSIFQHPVSRNLPWRDVRALLASLAEMEEEPNGNVKFRRNGQTLTVHPPRHKDLSDVQAVMDVRHFLERSALAAGGAAAAAPDGKHLLVVIDHREARVYRTEMRGSVPQRVTPEHDPAGAGRYLHDVGEAGTGQRRPESAAFYESVAKALRGADQVLLFGGGTGASSAMEQLLAALGRDHPDLAGRVVGSVVVDAQHLTEDQLLAKARDFYAKAAS